MTVEGQEYAASPLEAADGSHVVTTDVWASMGQEEEQAQREAAIAGTGSLPEVYAQAHYIWYVFTGIGVLGFVLLAVFRTLTDRLDAREG